jgi:hypothetical protein
MNFLWIIEVLTLIYIIKTYFLIHLFILTRHWTGPQNQRNPGALGVSFLRHRAQCNRTAGLIYHKQKGSLRNVHVEGVWLYLGRWIKIQWRRLDHSSSELVPDRSRWIWFWRSRFNYPIPTLDCTIEIGRPRSPEPSGSRRSNPSRSLIIWWPPRYHSPPAKHRRGSTTLRRTAAPFLSHCDHPYYRPNLQSAGWFTMHRSKWS